MRVEETSVIVESAGLQIRLGEKTEQNGRYLRDLL